MKLSACLSVCLSVCTQTFGEILHFSVGGYVAVLKQLRISATFLDHFLKTILYHKENFVVWFHFLSGGHLEIQIGCYGNCIFRREATGTPLLSQGSFGHYDLLKW